jgi:diguanylate cyclase (GGDEF)-like protein
VSIFKKNQLALKSAVLYFVVAILNITVFILIVFENQTDLIIENAVLNAEKKGINLKTKADNILGGKEEIDKGVLNQVLKEASFLGVREMAVFEENGKILVEIKSGKFTDRKTAGADEIKWINRAITRSNFEDKIFSHDIQSNKKEILLYIPVSYGIGKTLIIRPLLYMISVDQQMSRLYRQCIIIAILIILIHSGVGYFFSRIILLPLARLNEATEKIARGDLKARVQIVRDDEIGRLAISFNEMTVALARMQDEAKGANPLTGLPGNISIAKEIDDRLATDNKFAVMYCDLDNFKAYNDKYGFSKGDEIILYTCNSLLDAVKKKGGNKKVFIGHEGGDDFVGVADVEVWEEITKTFISSFDYKIASFYNETDAKNRYIESVNRQGVPMRFPLISISVAVVSNERRAFKSHTEIVSVAAEMKKFVKKKEGSCYAIDRRSNPPPQYPIKPLPPGTPPPGAPFPPGVKPAPVYNDPRKEQQNNLAVENKPLA